MERRFEPRYDIEEPVTVITLGENRAQFLGRVLNISITGIRLMVDRPLGLGAAIKIELRDHLLFGEVRYCTPEAGEYTVGLELIEYTDKREFEILIEGYMPEYYSG